MVERLRQQRIILPTLDVIERVSSEALTRGTRLVHEALTAPLSDPHRRALNALLSVREGGMGSGLAWLRQLPGPPRPKHILVQLERLKAIRELGLPEGLDHAIHQNRLMKLAREGGQMTAQHLRDLESKRRHADRFHQSGKAINDKVRLYSRIDRALLEARQTRGDPFRRHRDDSAVGGVQRERHRSDQPGIDQNGEILPRHNLRQTLMAAGLAHPRCDPCYAAEP